MDQEVPSEIEGRRVWESQQPDRIGIPPLPIAESLGRRGILLRPRVFVSHRRIDLSEAARIAWLADQEGFEFWLDALDPSLQQLQTIVGPGAVSPEQLALATASIIEMALLNSSHVMAVLTVRTPGSQWVPYEYGRVKERGPISTQAGCWIGFGVTNPPEYVHLGIKTFDERSIRRWFAQEYEKWVKTNHAPFSKPANGWHRPPPRPI